MSNLIPPLLSSSPPPIVGPLEEDDDDEFGDFRAAADSFDCDESSLPSSSPEKTTNSLDINRNSEKLSDFVEKPIEIESIESKKDFQDRRKSESIDTTESFSVNSTNSEPEINNSTTEELHTSEIKEDKSDLFPETEQEINVESFNTTEEPLNDDFGDFQKQFINNEIDSSELPLPIENSSTNLSCQIDHIIAEKDDLQISVDQNESEDDFGNFEGSEFNNKTDDLNYVKQEPDIENNDTDDEFGNFETPQILINDENKLGNQPVDINNDEDNEFGNFASPTDDKFEPNFAAFESAVTESDEFDEFGDFSSVNPVVTQKFHDIKQDVLTRSESVFKEIFPENKSEIDDIQIIDYTSNNKIFNELKDVTETNAVIYQWSKSHSQKMFLKALNIDSRNILYGPSWNSSMPRFAANLGLQPLEPIKSDILTPTPVQSSSSPSISSSQKPTSDNIPSAQFDWNGSGLVNPLDYSQTMLLDLEQLVASLDIPSTTISNPNFTNNSSPSPSSSIFLDEWEHWLQQTSEQQTTQSQPSQVPQPISPVENFEEIKQEITMPPKNEQTHVEVIQQTDFDDFTSFGSPKMIPLRETHIYNDCQESWLEPTILTPDLPRKEPIKCDNIEDEDDEFDDFQMCEQPKVETKQFSVEKPKEDEDEFTDFKSSAPPPLPVLQPITTPLMPTIQYNSTAQINWPDPGVSDEEIRNIELSYSRKSEVKLDATQNDDNDEWSDFVSVNQQPKILPEQQQRISTPDLPLSVLNLNNVQAPKQPIPVITPSGLMQTKLTSNNLPLQQKMTQPTLFKPQTTNQFQPAIVSSQFVANFYQGTNLNNAGFSPSHAPRIEQQNNHHHHHHQNGKNDEDEDDWSDFVSGQPPPITNNKTKISWNSNTNTTTTPNIITNPGHLFGFGQGGSGSSTNKKVVMSGRNLGGGNISSISAMPDLDFIGTSNGSSKSQRK